jgi:phosphoglucomutase
LKFIKDFESSSKQDPVNGNSSKLDFPKSNVLIFEAEDGTTVAARPSGTEPKIKFYISVNSKLESKSDYLKIDTLLENKIERVIKEFEF